MYQKKTMVSVSDTPNRKPVVTLSINGLIWFDQICLVKIARIQSLNNNMALPQAVCHYLTIDIFVAWTNTYLQAAKIGKIMSELTSHDGWIHSRHCRCTTQAKLWDISTLSPWWLRVQYRSLFHASFVRNVWFAYHFFRGSHLIKLTSNRSVHVKVKVKQTSQRHHWNNLTRRQPGIRYPWHTPTCSTAKPLQYFNHSSLGRLCRKLFPSQEIWVQCSALSPLQSLVCGVP